MDVLRGTTYLVGAGPGDPGLLTLRGAAVLAAADVVLHDYLVHPAILDHCPSHCERLFVGKRGGNAVCSQDEINRLLVDQHRDDRIVVRLKGGDPFAFGRGGEEARALVAAGCRFAIVPGITSGIAAAAYAGIPVTDRERAAAVTFLTGHRAAENDADHDWAALARVGTLVWYMAVKSFPFIAQRLIAAGLAADTPAAMIRWGTWPHQQVVTGTVASLAQAMHAADLHPPAVIVVGAVAALHADLAWYIPGPLAGRSVLMPRLLGRDDDLAERLRSLGARVLTLDADVALPTTTADLDAAIDRLEDFRWLIGASRLGTRCFLQRLRQRGSDLRRLAHLRLAARGAAATAEFRAHHLEPDLIAPDPSIDACARTILAACDEPARQAALLPGAVAGRGSLATALAAGGMPVTRVGVYDTRSRTRSLDLLSEDIAAVIVTSSSAADRLAGQIDVTERQRLVLRGTQVIASGEAAATALADHGWLVDRVAAAVSVEALVDVVAAACGQGRWVS